MPINNEAKIAALNNGHPFHVAAFTRDSNIIGVNSNKQSARYKRRFKDQSMAYQLHAEADLILKLRYIPERIWVVRFTKDGSVSMSRPCTHCQNFLRHNGVKTVYYTDWDGQWQKMNL